jgi:hypothetical protein
LYALRRLWEEAAQISSSGYKVPLLGPSHIIKGGNCRVWERFKISKEWRKSQGVVFGKRGGTTQSPSFGTAGERVDGLLCRPKQQTVKLVLRMPPELHKALVE